jgi:hypothetical protein
MIKEMLRSACSQNQHVLHLARPVHMAATTTSMSKWKPPHVSSETAAAASPRACVGCTIMLIYEILGRVASLCAVSHRSPSYQCALPHKACLSGSASAKRGTQQHQRGDEGLEPGRSCGLQLQCTCLCTRPRMHARACCVVCRRLQNQTGFPFLDMSKLGSCLFQSSK